MIRFGTTTQLDLYNNKVYHNVCQWCGRGFNKTHNRQIYCSKECSKNAERENTNRRVRNFRLRYCKRGGDWLGSGLLGEHAVTDFDEEHRKVRSELKRLGF